MHIEIRTEGKKRKYYLAHSYRDNGKVRKVRRYLGENLSEEKIKKLRERAEILIQEQINIIKEIRDPFNYILSTKEIKKLKDLDLKIPIKIQHLKEKDWIQFTERFTYDTNAIEGSTITYTEVKGIVEGDTWPRDASKEEISETYGVNEAVKYIRNIKTHISIQLIKDLHKLVFRNSKPFAGRLRPKGIEVGIRDKLGNLIHRGAPSTHVKSLLKELVEWYNDNKNKYPPLILAVVLHNQFETIHPYQDGNGRVGRLLLNNILLKHDYPPVNIELKNRNEYYSALQEYQKLGNIKPMINLILKEYRIMEKQLKYR